MKKKKIFNLILSLGVFAFFNFSKASYSSDIGYAMASNGYAQAFLAGAGGAAGAWAGARYGARLGAFWGPVGMIVGGGVGAL